MGAIGIMIGIGISIGIGIGIGIGIWIVTAIFGGNCFKIGVSGIIHGAVHIMCLIRVLFILFDCKKDNPYPVHARRYE